MDGAVNSGGGPRPWRDGAGTSTGTGGVGVPVLGAQTVGMMCVSPKSDSDELDSVEFLLLGAGVGQAGGGGLARMTYCFGDGRGAEGRERVEFEDVNVAGGENGGDVSSSRGGLDRFQAEWDAAIDRSERRRRCAWGCGGRGGATACSCWTASVRHGSRCAFSGGAGFGCWSTSSRLDHRAGYREPLSRHANADSRQRYRDGVPAIGMEARRTRLAEARCGVRQAGPKASPNATKARLHMSAANIGGGSGRCSRREESPRTPAWVDLAVTQR